MTKLSGTKGTMKKIREKKKDGNSTWKELRKVVESESTSIQIII